MVVEQVTFNKLELGTGFNVRKIRVRGWFSNRLGFRVMGWV